MTTPLPCPFCGGEAEEYTDGDGPRVGQAVWCTKCSAHTKVSLDKPRQGVEKWNARKGDALLRHVWNHMHGQNMDGTRRAYPGDDGCAANWAKLSDAIGEYLDEDESVGEVEE